MVRAERRAPPQEAERWHGDCKQQKRASLAGRTRRNRKHEPVPVRRSEPTAQARGPAAPARYDYTCIENSILPAPGAVVGTCGPGNCR